MHHFNKHLLFIPFAKRARRIRLIIQILIMEESRITIANRQRAVYFKIGLIIAISLVIMAFRWTVHPRPMESLFREVEEDDLFSPVVRTVQREKRLPPPALVKPSNEIVPEDVEVSFTPFVEKEILDDAMDFILEDEINNQAPIVNQPAPLPIPPEKEAEDLPFTIVEEMPLFGKCDHLAKTERKWCSDKQVLTYFAQNIKYPSMARSNGIEGLVVIQFVVGKDGQLTDLKVGRDIGGGCGAEALRVAQAMPEWKPGMQRGRAVKVKMTLPVKFQLAY